MRHAGPVLGLLAAVAAGCSSADGGVSAPHDPDAAAEAAEEAVVADAADAAEAAEADADTSVRDPTPDPAGEYATGDLPSTLGPDDRPAAVVVPAGYAPDREWPLVLLLHGYSADGFLQDGYLGLSLRLDDAGFILVRPDGTIDQDGFKFWNAMPACCDFFGSDVDDEAYLLGLLEQAKAVFRVAPGRVYLVGHSNGGFMSHRLACRAAGEFSAAAVLAGSSYADAADCTPARAVSLLAIHGTLDDSVLYDGEAKGPVHGAAAAYPGVEEVVARWKTLNECGAAVEDLGSADFDIGVKDAETLRTAWTGCRDGSRVELWKMVGSGHIPPITDAFRDALIAWLLAVDRP
jgi:polyhydroxybutyrate depolymerase